MRREQQWHLLIGGAQHLHLGVVGTHELLSVEHAKTLEGVRFISLLLLTLHTFELVLARSLSLVVLCDLDPLVCTQSVHYFVLHVQRQQVEQVLVDVPHLDAGRVGDY